MTEKQKKACRDYYWSHRKERLAYKKKYRSTAAHRKHHRNYMREYHKTHTTECLKLDLAEYGLTLELYNDLLKKQRGRCYICRKKETYGKRLSIDHNHRTGYVRKLLCRRCNRVLGNVNESPTLLERMLAYVKGEF